MERVRAFKQSRKYTMRQTFILMCESVTQSNDNDRDEFDFSFAFLKMGFSASLAMCKSLLWLSEVSKDVLDAIFLIPTFLV